MAMATFAAGCFWGVEWTFGRVPGVLRTTVGYMGGSKDAPTAAEVSTGLSGHAEVVQVEYDPGVVSYDELLDIFWNAHDPTTLNRQGADIGTQYRSAIFFHAPEQEAAARRSKSLWTANHRSPRPIVTEITPAGAFWPAEERHQHYYAKNGFADCGAR
jgi:peptide-methionine (S)-S-oxide reductase